MSITNKQMTTSVRKCAPLYANTIVRNYYLNGWVDTVNKDSNHCLFLEQQQNINFPRRHDNPTDDLINYTNNMHLNTRHTFRPRIREFFPDSSKVFYNPNTNMETNIHQYDEQIYDEPTQKPSIFSSISISQNDVFVYILIILVLFGSYKLLKN